MKLITGKAVVSASIGLLSGITVLIVAAMLLITLAGCQSIGSIRCVDAQRYDATVGEEWSKYVMADPFLDEAGRIFRLGFRTTFQESLAEFCIAGEGDVLCSAIVDYWGVVGTAYPSYVNNDDSLTDQEKRLMIAHNRSVFKNLTESDCLDSEIIR